MSGRGKGAEAPEGFQCACRGRKLLEGLRETRGPAVCVEGVTSVGSALPEPGCRWEERAVPLVSG